MAIWADIFIVFSIMWPIVSNVDVPRSPQLSPNITDYKEDYLLIADNTKNAQEDLDLRIASGLNKVKQASFRYVLLSDGTSGKILSLGKDEVDQVRSMEDVVWIGRKGEPFKKRTSSGRLKKVRISSRFIVTVRSADDKTVHKAKSSLRALGFKIVNEYRIGSFQGLLVEGDPERAHAIQTYMKHTLGGYTPNINRLGEDIDWLESDVDAFATDCNTHQQTGDELWGLSRVNVRDRPATYAGQRYNYSSQSDGSGVEVHVFDSGINIHHDDFGGRATIGYTAGDIKADEGDADLDGHGTHVAGTIGGLLYGVAKDVQMVSVKVIDKEGNGAVANIIEGMEWSYNQKQQNPNKKIIWNMSYGAEGISPAIGSALREANQGGIVIVVAAGNEYIEACSSTPGFSPDVITVAASGRTDMFSESANYGRCVDIVAPGEGILSAGIPGPTSTSTLQGTSMACPHVAGAVARLASVCPGTPPTEGARRWLQDTATKGRLSDVPADTVNLLLHLDCDIDPQDYCDQSPPGQPSAQPSIPTADTSTTTTTTIRPKPNPSVNTAHCHSSSSIGVLFMVVHLIYNSMYT